MVRIYIFYLNFTCNLAILLNPTRSGFFPEILGPGGGGGGGGRRVWALGVMVRGMISTRGTKTIRHNGIKFGVII